MWDTPNSTLHLKNINLKESSPKLKVHTNVVTIKTKKHTETFRKTETCCQCCATTFMNAIASLHYISQKQGGLVLFFLIVFD